MVANLAGAHTQMPGLMGEGPSLTISRPVAIQKYHGMIINPLRQSVDTRSAERLRKDDAPGGFQPAAAAQRSP